MDLPGLTPDQQRPKGGPIAAPALPKPPAAFDRRPLAVFRPRHVRYVERVHESIELNDRPGPCVIISASGMCELRMSVAIFWTWQVPHVLATLERTHRPENVARAVGAARAAGIDQVSLDLIYGTPGESSADWQASLDTALALEPDHVSAYALVVEEGTRLAGQVRRGEVGAPDDDDLADKYVLADETLGAAGLGWYEVSNWARDDATRCRHNMGYWRGEDWWGAGPGAHSHVGGVRWWNVKHPAAYAERLTGGNTPAQAREVLDEDQRTAERVLLGIRLADGLPPDALPSDATTATDEALARLVDDGLLDTDALDTGTLRLTLRGRLLADAVVRVLVA
jgi:oxygen-independent coproporphyrinogen-3 oxidase